MFMWAPNGELGEATHHASTTRVEIELQWSRVNSGRNAASVPRETKIV